MNTNHGFLWAIFSRTLKFVSVQVNIPIDYETEKHRGFAFIEFELPEDAQVKRRLGSKQLLK